MLMSDASKTGTTREDETSIPTILETLERLKG